MMKLFAVALFAFIATPLFAADSLGVGLTASAARIEGLAVSAPAARCCDTDNHAIAAHCAAHRRFARRR
jgi:hypothetical protein